MDRHMFDQIAKITDHLLLSSAAAVRGDRVKSLGITHIINCTMDVPNLNVANVECIQIHVDDIPSARLSLYFDRCSEKIDQIAKRGGRVLVHCVAGVSRSASLCIAYLVKCQRMSLKQAYWHVKSRRSVIYPNFGFWRQLIDFERRVTGTNSVKMINSGIGYIPDVLEEETRNMIWFGPQSTSYSGVSEPHSTSYSRAYGGGTLRASSIGYGGTSGAATSRVTYGGGTYRSRHGRY